MARGIEALRVLGRLLPAVGATAAAKRLRDGLAAWRQAVSARAASLVGARPSATTVFRRWPHVSLPLATALVAGIAVVVSLIDALDFAAEAPGAPDVDVAALSAEPGAGADDPLFALELAAPEPAAGPPGEAASEETGEAPSEAASEAAGAGHNQPANGRPASGRRALPEVPEVPIELDDIARELQRRRTEVLELEAALALREAAVRAAEADLAAQVDRLEAFKLELEALVGEAEAEEEERLQQLVSMYESMRAKSAAAIFNRLEMPVILAVAERMREAKMAAILAAMDPVRARVVTSELARERELPRLN